MCPELTISVSASLLRQTEVHNKSDCVEEEEDRSDIESGYQTMDGDRTKENPPDST